VYLETRSINYLSANTVVETYFVANTGFASFYSSDYTCNSERTSALVKVSENFLENYETVHVVVTSF